MARKNQRSVRQKPCPSSNTPPPSRAARKKQQLGMWGILPRDAEMAILSFLPYDNIIKLSLTCSTLYKREHHVHVPDRLEVQRRNLTPFFSSRLRKKGGGHQARVVMRRLETFKIVGVDQFHRFSINKGHLLPGLYHLPYLFPNLVRLNLADSIMGTEGINRLLDAVKRNPWKTLRELNVANNCITSSGFERLSRIVSRCPNLEVLDLENNSIGGEAFEPSLLRILRPQLLHLNLADNQVTGEGMEQLSSALGQGRSPRLRFLSLATNSFSNPSLVHFAGAMHTGHLQELRHLNFSSVSSYEDGDDGPGEQGTVALSEALRARCCPMLEVLNLADMEMCTEGIRSLTGALKAGSCPHLQVLNLSENFINGTGMILLTFALISKGCPELTTLILDACENIGDAGVTVLMDALQSRPCPNFSTLGLRYVGMTDEGIKALANGFSRGDLMKVKVLGLEYNSISNFGAEMLCQAFRQAPAPLALTELRMRRTEVGNVGIRNFTTLLLQDPSFLPHLRELDFRSSYIVDSHKLRKTSRALKKTRGGLKLLFNEDTF